MSTAIGSIRLGLGLGLANGGSPLGSVPSTDFGKLLSFNGVALSFNGVALSFSGS